MRGIPNRAGQFDTRAGDSELALDGSDGDGPRLTPSNPAVLKSYASGPVAGGTPPVTVLAADPSEARGSSVDALAVTEQGQ